MDFNDWLSEQEQPCSICGENCEHECDMDGERECVLPDDLPF